MDLDKDQIQHLMDLLGLNLTNMDLDYIQFHSILF